MGVDGGPSSGSPTSPAAGGDDDRRCRSAGAGAGPPATKPVERTGTRSGVSGPEGLLEAREARVGVDEDRVEMRVGQPQARSS